MQDIRWKQRLDSFEIALKQLSEGVGLLKKQPLSNLEKQGLIQAFEFTHELAWNLLKDYLEFQGTPGITGPRDAVREAFNKGLIMEGESWMEMILSRNKTSHTYNKKIAEEIVAKIANQYHDLFLSLKNKMENLK